MSGFLDIEAELDSENEYLDEKEEQGVSQDDQDFIDDSPQADTSYPPLPRITASEDVDISRKGSLWNRWGGRDSYEAFLKSYVNGGLKSRDSSQRSEAGEGILMARDDLFVSTSEGSEAAKEAHQSLDFSGEEPHEDLIARILRRADAEEPFIDRIPPRAAIPPDGAKKYTHFQRPRHAFGSSYPAPVPDSTSSLHTETPPHFRLRKNLEDLSVSLASYGTFAPPKRYSDMKEWRQWASRSRREAPNEHARRREAAPGEWVKVLQGLYKGDVGMVWKPGETASGHCGYFLLLVPRLSGSKKRKRERPPFALFNPEDVKEAEQGEDAFTFRFRGKTFSHGLLVKFLDELAIEQARVLAPEARQQFSSCRHPFIKMFPFPLPEFFVFEVGDQVRVKGRGGIVTHVGDSLCVVDFGDDGEHSCLVHSLEKDVSPGDAIKVAAGVHDGREGLVAERHGAIAYVSVRHSDTRGNFFVHVNSLKLQRESFDTAPADDVPWTGVRVVVTRGRYKEMQGVVRGVRLTLRRDRLVVLVYIPVFQCSAALDYDHVVEQGTTKKLLDFSPLSETQSKFKIDPVMAAMRSGRVPWIGTRVRIIAGVHKGKEGIVRDVNRPFRGFEESGLAVSVELYVISPNMSHRIEAIDYARICEFDSSLELAKFMPLTREQDFYTPWVGKQKRGGKGRLPVPATKNPYLASSQTPQHTSEYEDIDLDDPYNPWNPHSLSPSIWSAPDFLSRPPSPLGPVTSLDSNPFCIPETPGSPDPYRLYDPAPPLVLSHPLLHPNLLGISIRVTIISGKWKRKTAFVTPTSGEDGPFFAFRLKEEMHRIDHRCVGKHPELPKPNSEQGLMVITSGAEQHIGKFVRRAFYFYNEQKSDDARWFIAAVVDRSGSQDSLTRELLEFSPADVDIVEESATDRAAGNLLLESIRYAAKIGKPEVRRPGAGDLGYLYASISETAVLNE